MTFFGHTFTGAELMFISMAAWWVFSALSYALPAPPPTAGLVYQTVYRLVHFAAANLDRVKKGEP